MNALIAQLVEQGTENPCVTGSIPVRGTKIIVSKLSRYYYFFYFYNGNRKGRAETK